MQSNLLEIANLGKTYKGGKDAIHALHDLNLQVRTGEILGVLGPNGAGKTTTVKLIMGLLQPSAGVLHFKNTPLESQQIRSGIGYLPENFRPNPNLTVAEYVRLHCRLAQSADNGASAGVQQAAELLEMVGMNGFEKRKIAHLSKGMGQRVGLAQAFAGDPEFLILDEPTSGLDPIGKKEVIDFLLQMKARGKTILFCSHILSEVEKLCDRIGIMVGGQLRFIGTAQEFLDKWEVTDLEHGFTLEAQCTTS